MKKWLIWAAILAGLIGPANAAGTVPGFSLTPQFDNFGKVAPGCRLYVIQAGTTQTPQQPYQDSALTILQPNPLTCDATGRLPQWFVADGLIKVRLTDKNGVQLFSGDNLLVIGASSGGGGGGTVDPTTIMATGDLKVRYGTGVLSGFVRANGRTIGSATSGATERANSDSQALFEYLWNADSNLAVSPSRGASSNADWVANKTIALPDWRGRAIGALADMGNSATTALTSAYFGTDPTILGASATADQFFTLLQGNLPNINFTVNDPGHNHQTTVAQPATGSRINGNSSPVDVWGGSTAPNTTFTSTTSFTGISVSSGGSSAPIGRVSNLKLATIYLKL